MSNGFDLIIFDCDGVLVDSEIIAAEVESKLLTDAGYPISTEEMGERFAGMTWRNILFEVEREASIPLSASLLDKSEKLLDLKLANDVQAIPGVPLALSRLPMPRCICSNSSAARLDMMLSKVGYLKLFAPHIYSAKDLGMASSKTERITDHTEKRPRHTAGPFSFHDGEHLRSNDRGDALNGASCAPASRLLQPSAGLDQS